MTPHHSLRSLAAGTLAACAIAACTIAAASSLGAQPPSPFTTLARNVEREISGDRARATVAFVEQYFRLPGNRGFDASIDTVAALLDAAIADGAGDLDNAAIIDTIRRWRAPAIR